MSERTAHRWAVEGIEDGVARVEEDGVRMISVPVRTLPRGTQTGQVLRAIKVGTSFTVELDEAETRAALDRSKATTDAAMAESRRRDTGGDVSL